MAVTRIDWDECRKIFAWDGSWRNIYVLGTDLRDWQRLLDFMRGSGYPVKYSQAGQDAPLPRSAEQVFGRRYATAPLMWVDVRGVTLACHLFGTGDIEFDIDPREVDEGSKAEGLFDFMARVGRLLGKDVVLTPENMQDIALVRYDAEADTINHRFVEWW
jgi:hypothetical protein